MRDRKLSQSTRRLFSIYIEYSKHRRKAAALFIRAHKSNSALKQQLCDRDLPLSAALKGLDLAHVAAITLEEIIKDKTTVLDKL